MVYEEEHFVETSGLVWNYSQFSDDDISRFREGNMYDGYTKFGAHQVSVLGTYGFYFSVWAPNATSVSVIGDFNGWKPELHKLFVRLDKSGIWEGFIPRLPTGVLYKFHITGFEGKVVEKADPYARYAELRPGTASITWKSQTPWKDGEWMEHRKKHNSLSSPWSVYEVHLGSWMRPDKYDENAYNDYYFLGDKLVSYVKGMGFTHVEFMPVMEHPYDGSWGYQQTGYFAPTSRYGDPDGFKFLVEAFHNAGIGVILDWVPSHFPHDAHGLFSFDGTHTYEYSDMRKGYHPDWHSYIFNYKRGEVVSFLISSAHFWLNEFHADGLRVDAVNSIIRLDFSRKEGEWEPNELGGNENLEAIDFLKKLNTVIYRDFPDVQTIAEESSDWPGITHSVEKGGFGFGMKWMMGWMHDTFRYFKTTPGERISAHDKFTFSMMYFYDEKFMLPFSHDEIVHGKSPMLYKMPGTESDKFASLRMLYAYMYMHPGAKLLFMGNEFGDTSEWNERSELNWPLLQFIPHSKLQECVKDLNHMYNSFPALYEMQFHPKGFEWIYIDERSEGLFLFKRKGKRPGADMVILLNVSAENYRSKSFLIPGKSALNLLFNTNNLNYRDGNEEQDLNFRTVKADKKKKQCEINLDIPPLTVIVFH